MPQHPVRATLQVRSVITCKARRAKARQADGQLEASSSSAPAGLSEPRRSELQAEADAGVSHASRPRRSPPSGACQPFHPRTPAANEGQVGCCCGAGCVGRKKRVTRTPAVDRLPGQAGQQETTRLSLSSCTRTTTEDRTDRPPSSSSVFPSRAFPGTVLLGVVACGPNRLEP